MKANNSLTLSLRQQGNSVGITLPKAFLDSLGLVKGAQVDVELKAGVIELRPHNEQPSIEQLMSGYDPQNHNYGELIPADIGSELFNEEKS